MATMIVVVEPENIAPLMRWAERFAGVWGSHKLVVLCCMFDSVSEPPKGVSDEEASADLGVVGETFREARSLKGMEVEVLSMRDTAPASVILGEIRSRGIDHLIVATNGLWASESAQSQLADHLLRSASCEVVLLDAGDSEGYRRGAVSMGRIGDGAALRLASNLVGDDGTVVPLLVASEYTVDAEDVGHRELAMHLRDAGVEENEPGVEPRVMPAKNHVEGLLRASRDCDLVLIPGSSGRDVREFRTSERILFPHGGVAQPAVAIYRRARQGRWYLPRIRSILKAWLPELTLADRVAMFDHVQSMSRWNVDFAVMLGLSAAIASLGLIINSIPVIIGAMLVAPLMTPLVGAGLALAQGNVRLFRRSIVALIGGILTGFVLSLLIGLITLHEIDLPLEVEIRGQPDLFDLGIAFLSGVAVAYAFSRRTVAEAIVGVAISAALLPPLAASAVAIAYGRYIVAEGAAILFITNLAAIILGAGLTFHVLGVHGTRVAAKWIRRVVLGLSVLIVLLLVPLGYQLADRVTIGQTRPMGFPLSKKVRNAVRTRVDREPGVSVLLMGRSGFEADTDVGIALLADRPVEQAFIKELKELVHDIRGRDIRIIVNVVRQAEIKTEAPVVEPPVEH